MNPIFARRVSIFFKSGVRTDYTHVVEFRVITTVFASKKGEHLLLIRGETDDVDGTPYVAVDRIPIKDIQHTYIDWYLPPE